MNGLHLTAAREAAAGDGAAARLAGGWLQPAMSAADPAAIAMTCLVLLTVSLPPALDEGAVRGLDAAWPARTDDAARAGRVYIGHGSPGQRDTPGRSGLGRYVTPSP
jgi:hypothetical protein